MSIQRIDRLDPLREPLRNVIIELPKTWGSALFGSYFGLRYLNEFTRKEVFLINFVAMILGIIAGLASVGFRNLIGTLQNLFLYSRWDHELVSPIGHTQGYWLFAIVPGAFLVSYMLTRFFAPEAKGHGVPEVIEAVLSKDSKIRPRVTFVKALASAITISGGGSVGREGPIVQIGSAIGSTLGQMLNFHPRILRTLVGCGAAGAISATFNTPIAGVIFAIEVIVLEFRTRSFVPLVISSVFAAITSRAIIGDERAFFVPFYSLTSPLEIVLYFGLGVSAGILGYLVIKTLYGIEDFVDEIKVNGFLKPIAGGLIVAAIGLYYPEILGVGYEAVSKVLQQDAELGWLLALVVLKIFAMSVTLATGGSGGVFAPSLFIGAMLGGAYGLLTEYFWPGTSAGFGAYALVGMAALFSATGRATFTAIVILFEMTLEYSIILPLMFACVTADIVSWSFSKDSIYSKKLKRKGLSFITEIGVNILGITKVQDLMTRELEVLKDDTSIEEAKEMVQRTNHSLYPVVDREGCLLGVVKSEEILECTTSIAEVMHSTPIVVGPNTTVSEALNNMKSERDPRILVVDPKTRKLMGIVSPADLVRLTHREIDT